MIERLMVCQVAWIAWGLANNRKGEPGWAHFMAMEIIALEANGWEVFA